MSKSDKVFPTEKIHIFKKKKQHFQFFYVKKFFLLLKQKRVAYPLAVILLVLVLYGYGYSISGRQKEFDNLNPILRLVEHANHFFLTGCILATILGIPQNSQNYYDFFIALYPEGNKLLGPLLAMKKHYFWRQFFICNVCIGTLIALNAWFYMTNFGWRIYKYIIFKDVNFYVFNLILCLLLALTRKIELRFSELNEMLLYKTDNFLKKKVSKQLDDPVENRLAFMLSSEHFYSVRTFRIMHYDLCNLVKRFNDIFGYILLGSVVFQIFNLLSKVTFIIEFCVLGDDEARSKWAFYLGIIGLWITANMVQAYLLAFYGEQITKEGEQTTKICFYLLNKVSIHPKSEDEKLVQDELKVLAFQSYSNIPSLAAGGFFNINFKVLGLLISSSTSYLMVIIQFLLRKPT